MKQKVKNNLFYMRKNYLLYLLVLPAIVLTFIFKYVPIYGLLIAFKNYNPLQGIIGSEWVGLEHFTRFLSSPNFMILLVNTLKLSVYGLLLGFFPPIILAISFNLLASDKLKKRLQLILYAPNFISVVIIVGMIFLFFSNKGPVNHIYEFFTGKTVPFLTEPDFFRPLYIFSGIWQGIGWSSILYTATLSNVSPELIDAAKIDGANILQRIWHVDIPAIKPVMVISFILAAGGIMSVGYEKAYLMQTTMNLPSSEIIATYVYKVGLQSGDYSYSTAVGLFNSLINLILIIAVNQTVKKLNDGEGL
ncbi:MAG: ABC transporter permease subunit [Carnobacterium sp.]|nr:ABC transporter permease subunit [Carnobacterium maltaromaticum]AOA03431.1 ABC transporter permease [Carnobacterium maltaromaticum]KRN63975.1 ABC-type polysaccharide transport system, permease component [Carnobacterium maltaromaticum DSM 20342]MBC9809809.1 ABC transporter permease subunit [Carnobacterium maltaromaticum]MCI1819915.1 ABC transporter permease subunit [Carnobacterium maltaromaticum]MDW5523941.1 ABC transporter permease subunit [Carnobacterium maltaromaticum]